MTTDLLQSLEATAARGADGLSPAARAELVAALRGLQRPDGGFAGLDGRSDPYYTLFAWLSLRALGAPAARGPLRDYLSACRRPARGIDARCAALVLSVEGRRARAPWLPVLAAAWRGDAYGAFLAALAAGGVPRWAARLAWRRQRDRIERGAERLPTPRLAAGLLLATLAASDSARLRAALAARRSPSGGFAAAPGAAPDLLATAVARFACGAGARERAAERADLAFIESCWCGEGLFGASPGVARGDAEHTFYALLALGTCR